MKEINGTMTSSTERIYRVEMFNDIGFSDDWLFLVSTIYWISLDASPVNEKKEQAF